MTIRLRPAAQRSILVDHFHRAWTETYCTQRAAHTGAAPLADLRTDHDVLVSELKPALLFASPETKCVGTRSLARQCA